MCVCMHNEMCVHTHISPLSTNLCDMHFNFALLREFYGVFSTYKNKSFVETCRHMPLSPTPTMATTL